jgi:hypothetical protein|tara:strand:- start:121 stop:540 length:420 start_codon:yes stop_codon:yes gene_type:complete
MAAMVDETDDNTFEICAFGDMLQFYAYHEITDWIWHHIDACARHGLVHSDKDTFMMARPVDSSIPVDDLNALLDLSSTDQKSELTSKHDAWHIVYASGGLTKFFDKAPYPLPKVMWQRDGSGPARIHSFNNIKKRIHGK